MTGFSNPDDSTAVKGAKLLVKGAQAYSQHSHIIKQVIGGIIFALATAFITDWVDLWPINDKANTIAEEQVKDQNTSAKLQSGFSIPPYLSLPWFLVPLGLLGGGLLTLSGTVGGSRDKKELVAKVTILEADAIRLATSESCLHAEISNLNELLKKETEANYHLASEVYESYKAQISLWLTMVSQELQFGEDHRITAYLLDDDKTNFLPLGRYSKNPDFNEQGRAHFPIKKCAISLAFKKGKSVNTGIPDHARNKKQYIAHLKHHYGYTAAIIEGLVMHCRSIIGISVENHERRHVGVIVFESMKNDLDEDILVSFCKRENSRMLEFIQETQRRARSFGNPRDRHLDEGEIGND